MEAVSLKVCCEEHLFLSDDEKEIALYRRLGISLSGAPEDICKLQNKPKLKSVVVLPGIARFSEGPLFRRSVVPKVRCSEGPLFRRSVVPKVHCSEGSLLRN